MTAHDDDPSDDLSGSAYNTAEAAKFEIPEKNYEPWHLPRKHYLRIHQWCSHAKKLISEIASELSRRPLRYLSLPGDELLDIRTLHGVCDAAGVDLEYLGFNTRGGARDVECQISESEVRELRRINKPHSQVLNDNIEQIRIADSVAARHAWRSSFDVINLDFCSSITGDGLELLRSVLDRQRTSRALPWLLFLTTRADSGAVDGAIRSALSVPVNLNIASEPLFAKELAHTLGATKAVLDDDWRGISTTAHPRLFSLGLSKWMLNLLFNAAPRWTPSLVHSATYRVHGSDPDMMSLVFKFEQHRTPLGGGSESSQASEPAIALNVLQHLHARTLDVDNFLRSDRSAWSKVVEQFRRILAKARHDLGEYDKWVEEEEQRRQLR